MPSHDHDSTIRRACAMLDSYRFEYAALPLYEALIAYRDEGHPVGGFLTALLSGDYREAIHHADDVNRWLMPIYAAFLYNAFPANLHGSRENVTAWLELNEERIRGEAVLADDARSRERDARSEVPADE